jgi:tripeptidyl-peptidase-2
VRPSSSSIVPLPGPRDSPLPNGRVVYRCLLQYSFSLGEAGKYSPCVPLLNK